MLLVFFVLLVVFGGLAVLLGAAPVATVRQTPTGIKLEDGYRSTITFANDPNLSLWEIGVGTPGVDGGDPIDTTTMHNSTYRTMAARALKTLTEFTFTAAYDPSVYSDLEAAINVETTVTRTFPDGSTIAFYGFLRMVEFDDLVEGEMPTCTATVTPTNWDPVNKVEAGPTVTSVAGT